MAIVFSVQTIVNIYVEFKTIIKSGNYEKIVLEIMNSSEKMFRSKYIHQQNQSHGECDFVDELTGEKYDVKLPLDKKQGKLLGSNNCNYDAWLKTMIDEALEFSDVVKNRGNYNTEELELYKVVKNRLETVKKDENLILFFPFPIIPCEVPGSIYIPVKSNILTLIFDTLEKNGLVKNRNIYAIYPCVGNKLAIRLLNERICEFVSDQPLKKYINYNISFMLD